MNNIQKLFKKNKTEELKCFTKTISGDMRGSHFKCEIMPFDETRAVIRISTSESHDSEKVEKTGYVDKAVLEEITDVFNKYNMRKWKEKKLNEVFVADGANTSYYFDFKDERIHFSSQMYPLDYAEKLRELNNIIKKYTEAAEMK